MIWIGTSGYNYPEWKGSFYPSNLAAAKMLPYYAARFPTVEINYTFYRMPNEKLVAGWAAQTPSPYKLTLKAPRRITHDSRLKNCGELVGGFCQVAGTLGDKLGALLFQLPPNLEGSAAVRRVPRRAAAEGPGRVRVPASSRGSTTRCSSGSRREASRCASPTARRCRRRCGSRPTTPISGCATKATRATTSGAGPTPSARDGVVPRRVRLLQARGRGERPRVRRHASRAAGHVVVA